MPELPEVETIKRDLEKVILGKKIIAVVINRTNIIKEPGIGKFKRLLLYSQCIKIFRRGKLLILELRTKDKQKYFLTIHLRMSGQLIFGKKEPQSRLSLELSDKNFLNYIDQRILGELRLVTDWHNLNIVKNMGPEPFDKDFTLDEFKQRLSKRKMKIKPLLLDQTFIAGIGNIYAAEALFASGISPARGANRLANHEKKELFGNIKKVLSKAIKSRGTTFGAYRDGQGKKGKFKQQLLVYGRKGKACFKCRGPIKRRVLCGRGTYYCSQCQT